MRKFRDMIAHRVDTPKSRLASALYTEFVDHAILRHLWTNVKEIDAGVLRSNHPTTGRLKRFQAAGGASVVNLRGAIYSAPVILEQDACARLGLDYHWVSMVSGALPTRETVCKLVETMSDAQRPVLMHCKSGADRTGLAAGIYLMAFKGASPQEAAKQLTWRHAHLRHGKKGVLRRFFDMYQPAYEAGRDFMDWVRNDYDPGAACAA